MLLHRSFVFLRAAEFIDSVKVLLASGAGGDGVSIMAHEHGNEFAGPGGGNGGNGGSILARCVSDQPDLRHIRDMGSSLTAETGQSGYARQAHGRKGKDLWLPLPIGSQITDVDTHTVLFDLDVPGVEVMLLEGGQGGKGNAAFANKWHHSPIESTRGLPGNTMLAQIELKLIADCGLIGYPNAGKSSLLAAITSSKPAIAPYPFTTLRPYVGVLHDIFGNTCKIADLPGLIEGAYENRGLGHQFLRHVERSKVLAYVVDMASTSPQPWEAVRRLQLELEYYSPDLSKRSVMVLGNKMDIEEDMKGVKLDWKLKELIRCVPELPVFPVSALLSNSFCDSVAPESHLLLKTHRSDCGLTPALEYLVRYVVALQQKEKQERRKLEEDEQRELQRFFELKHNGVFRRGTSSALPFKNSTETIGTRANGGGITGETDETTLNDVVEEEVETLDPYGSFDSEGHSLVDQQLGNIFGDNGLDTKKGDAYEHSIAHRAFHRYRDWTMNGFGFKSRVQGT